MSSYTTVSGDTWDMIAYKAMGSESYIDTLMKANLQHRATVIFSAGVTLTVPQIDETISDTLPPWKR